MGAQEDEAASADVLVRTYDVALLDLDGVVYIGPDPVEYAASALKLARASGMRLAFVTNNAARPPDAVAGHLTRIGIDADPDEVITSAQAAARLLADELPAGANVLVVGGAGLHEALRERGLVPVSSLDDDPRAVVQGFAPEVDWRALAEGSYAVARGLPWVASNADLTIPTAQGIAPGNGALIGVVHAATGREPVVAGKPETPMHREAVVRTGAVNPLVVGDRLDTDIEGARRGEVDSLLVLSGVTSAEQLVTAPPHQRPTYVGYDLRALHQPAGGLVIETGQRRRGRWLASVEGAKTTLTSVSDGDGSPSADGAGSAEQDWLDALRAVCGAAWASDREVDVSSVRAALDDVAHRAAR